MAELAAAGSVVGIVSLAIQLGDVALKLKAFAKRLRDVPAALERIVLEVTALQLHIQQLEQYQTGLSTTSLASLEQDIAAQLCKSSVDSISRLVGEIESKLKKSETRGRLLFVAKDAELRNLLEELQREKTSLILATQMLTEAQRRRDNQVMLQAMQLQVQSLQSGLSRVVDDSRPNGTTGDESDANATDNVVVSKPLRTPQAMKRFHLNLSARFLNTVFTFAAIRSYAGWQAQILTSNIVPPDSEIFALCGAGDVVGVRKLISEGKASPLDCCIEFDGWPMDTFRAASEHLAEHPESTLDLLKYLGRVTTLPNPSHTLYQFLWSLLGPNGEKPPNWDSYVANSLLSRVLESCNLHLDDLPDVSDMRLSVSDPIWVMFGQNNIMYRQWSMQSPTALDVVYYRWAYNDLSAHDAQDFLKACGVDDVDASFAKQHRNGRSALHFAARALGETHSSGYWSRRGIRRHGRRRPSRKQHADWFALCQALIKNGADYSRRGEYNGSPLDWYIGFCDLCEILTVLGTWTELLIAAGISVHSFWTTEVVAHSSVGTQWEVYVDADTAHAHARAGRSASVEPYTVKCSVNLSVYHLKPWKIPGSWKSTDHSLPDTICWCPEEYEHEEGAWSNISDSVPRIEYKRVSAATFLQEHNDQTRDPYRAALEGTQDDSFPLALLLSHKPQRRRRRSASQPPLRARSGATYVGVHSVDGHAWSPRVHFCPCESRRALCGGGFYDQQLEIKTVPIRYCFLGAEIGQRVSDGWYSSVENPHAVLGQFCGQCGNSWIGDKDWRCTNHERWAFE